MTFCSDGRFRRVRRRQLPTFYGLDEDATTSARFRIHPGPIEDCLIWHPAVQIAAVLDEQCAEDRRRSRSAQRQLFDASDAPVRELQQHVRTRLAAHEYPREVRFAAQLPMTATVKLIRKTLRIEFTRKP